MKHTERLEVRVSPTIMQRIRALSEKREESISTTIRAALAKFIKEQEK